MIALDDQVQEPLCLTLRKSPEITRFTGHMGTINGLPLELSRFEDSHQGCVPHPDQNKGCGWECEKSGLAIVTTLP